MPKVEVWKCPKTKKVFFGRDEYREHILALRTRVNAERAWKRERNLIKERVWYAINSISSPRVLAEYVQKHFHDIMIAHNGTTPTIVEVIREMEMTDFRFVNLGYREHCSNTHEAPRDGVQNWSKDEDKPTGYPGFRGRVEYTVTNRPKSLDERLERGNGSHIVLDINSTLKYIGIKTSNGSTRTDTGKARYDVTLFLSDFRAMKKAYFHAKLEDRDFMEA